MCICLQNKLFKLAVATGQIHLAEKILMSDLPFRSDGKPYLDHGGSWYDFVSATGPFARHPMEKRHALERILRLRIFRIREVISLSTGCSEIECMK